MSDEQALSKPGQRTAVFVDNSLIERLLRGDDPTKVAQRPLETADGELPDSPRGETTEPGQIISEGRPSATAALPEALELAEQGQLDEAIKVLEAAANEGADPVEIYTALGQLRFEQSNWALAAVSFAKVIHLEPDSAVSHHNLGLSLERQGKFGEAATEFEAAASLDQNMWQALAGLGMCLLHTGQPTLAGHCFDQSLALEPDQERSQFGKALTAHKLGRLETAAKGYRGLLAKHVEDGVTSSAAEDLLINLVNVSVGLGHLDDARQFAEELLKVNPESRPALEQLTALALGERDFSGALLPATQLVKVAPESYPGWFNLGVAYHKTGRLDEAREAYQQAVAIDPDAAEANANLGAVLQQLNEMETARAAYQTALASSPGLPGVFWNLSLAAEADGLLEEAELYLHQLLELDSSWGEAAFRLGHLQLQRGDFTAARSSFETCVEQRPNWVEALLNLGLACWQTDDLDASRVAFEKILVENPINADALKGGLAVAMEHKDLERSWTLHARLMETGERSVELSFNLGLLLQQSGNTERSVECYRYALEGQDDYAPALINLGHALETLGRQTDARGQWAKAISADAALTARYFE